ncbi:MAG TPA: hypothetical protein VG015_07420 [Candidatus Dormibacteraeota bacterium]|nr:hypothetical protein [Candidatus Dormibacteraeota bacterium]
MTAAQLRTLRRRCERRLAVLPISDPLNIETFAASIAQRRGRPLEILPMEGVGGGTLGAWIAIDNPPRDLIVYEAATSALHQEHIILHELCHLVCDHGPRAVGSDVPRLLFPDLQSDLVRGVLNRQAYSTVDELEAELLATLICERAGRGARRTPKPVCPPGGFVGRFQLFSE